MDSINKAIEQAVVDASKATYDKIKSEIAQERKEEMNVLRKEIAEIVSKDMADKLEKSLSEFYSKMSEMSFDKATEAFKSAASDLLQDTKDIESRVKTLLTRNQKSVQRMIGDFYTKMSQMSFEKATEVFRGAMESMELNIEMPPIQLEKDTFKIHLPEQKKTITYDKFNKPTEIITKSIESD